MAPILRTIGEQICGGTKEGGDIMFYSWKKDIIELLCETQKANVHLEHIITLMTLSMKYQANRDIRRADCIQAGQSSEEKFVNLEEPWNDSR